MLLPHWKPNQQKSAVASKWLHKFVLCWWHGASFFFEILCREPGGWLPTSSVKYTLLIHVVVLFCFLTLWILQPVWFKSCYSDQMENNARLQWYSIWQHLQGFAVGNENSAISNQETVSTSAKQVCTCVCTCVCRCTCTFVLHLTAMQNHVNAQRTVQTLSFKLFTFIIRAITFLVSILYREVHCTEFQSHSLTNISFIFFKFFIFRYFILCSPSS